MRKCDGGELKQCAIAEGMETLRQDGWRRVAQGKTTIEEVVRVTQTDEVMAETTEEAEPVVGSRSGRNTLARWRSLVISFAAQFPDCFGVILRVKDRCPGDEDIGAVFD